MACKLVKLPDGGTAILCGSREKRRPCHYCNRPGGFLCDHPVIRKGKRTTCDTSMCSDCRNNVSADIDLCRPHFNLYRNNGNKFSIGGLG